MSWSATDDGGYLLLDQQTWQLTLEALTGDTEKQTAAAEALRLAAPPGWPDEP